MLHVTIGLIIGMLFLGACQERGVGGPGPEDSYPNPVEDITFTSTPRPEPKPGESVYPEIENNSDVVWHIAESLISNGEVERIVLLDAIRFQMFLKDGRIINSGRPKKDSIANLIQDCGEVCQDILIEE